jgi:hypothetical protein
LLQWQPSAGGLVIYGGRISALTMRTTSFGQNGALALRHVAGSGLDIVEQRSGRFEIHGSALRHLAISGPIDDRHSQVGDEAEIAVAITATSIAQSWISDGFLGTVTLTNCSIMQFWNNSAGVVALAVESGYLGLVGVDPVEAAPLLAGVQVTDISAIRGIEGSAERFRRMDYRRDGSIADDPSLTSQEGSAAQSP